MKIRLLRKQRKRQTKRKEKEKEEKQKQEKEKSENQTEKQEDIKVISPDKNIQDEQKDNQSEIVEEPQSNSQQEVSAENSQPEAVTGAVQLYEGSYNDERVYGDNPDCPESPASLKISNITETSFDFCITQHNRNSNEEEVIFLTNTAIFTEDGTTAAFYGKQYTLYFTFPDYYSALPDVVSIEVSGFEPVEGVTFSDNGIPGHEFS